MTLSDPVTSSSPNRFLTTTQAFGKATARAKKKLPKSPRRKRSHFSPCFQSFSVLKKSCI